MIVQPTPRDKTMPQKLNKIRFHSSPSRAFPTFKMLFFVVGGELEVFVVIPACALPHSDAHFVSGYCREITGATEQPQWIFRSSYRVIRLHAP